MLAGIVAIATTAALVPSPAAYAQAVSCVGDCNGDGSVGVDEITVMINIALDSQPVSACPAGDPDGSGEITVDRILAAVGNALNECPALPNTATATETSTAVPPSPTPTEPLPPSPTSTEPLATASITPLPTATAAPSLPAAGAGLVGAITSVQIGPDPAGQIAVTFTLTDAKGNPITPQSASTTDPQRARVRLTIAHVENYSGGGDLETELSRYVNDINTTRPAYDSGGTLQTLNALTGLYRYTFKTQLPAGFDPSQTYTVGLQVDRTFGGVQLSANPIYDTVPAGGTPQIRAASTTAQCNTCHEPLILHGNRRELRLCTLCHTEAAVDTKGTSIDLRNMIHKIHRGKELPSVVNGAPGAFYGIFSNFSQQYVKFAEKDAAGKVTGVGFPRPIQDCAVCHSDGPTAASHRTLPSAAACVACHDDVNPSMETTAAGPAGTNHFQGRAFADGDCTFCHTAASDKELDISVPGAHVVPERSAQLSGLNLAITGVTNHQAGQAPVIAFRVTDNAGNALRSLSGLNRVGFAIAGPTTDYATVFAPTAFGGGATGTLAGPDDTGIFQYTPTTPIPATAKGTWSIGAEARRSVTLAAVDPIEPKTVNEAAVNPVVTFSVDGSTGLARRSVVDDQKCGVCHGEFSKGFSIHGNLRNQIEYCVVCHNPNASDVARRRRDSVAVAAGDDTASIDFKVMIHKIHSGENLEQKPYLIYGFGAAPLNYSILDFSDVLYPGDRRNCSKCHAGNSYLVPPYPGAALGTQHAHLDPTTGNEVIDGHTGPITSVCTSCHDSEDAVAHAETQTASNGAEACAVCHEEGRAFPVSMLHAGRN
jgi:OmcA/MtrC family decaheme c-type cytochrome